MARQELKNFLASVGMLPADPPELRRVAFISHSTRDGRAPVHEIDSALTALGLNPFVAHRDISPSKAWRDEIKRRLARCRVFLALLTPNYRESEWCDQEAGYIVSRNDVVVIPVNISLDSYGFLSDYQELRWDTGRFVRHNQNEKRLAQCLIERGATDRQTMIEGVGAAKNFRSVDLVVELLSEACRNRPLSEIEAIRLAQSAATNDQVYRNGTARAIIPSLLNPHNSRIATSTVEKLRALGFAV